jgi:hypothetical protein
VEVHKTGGLNANNEVGNNEVGFRHLICPGSGVKRHMSHVHLMRKQMCQMSITNYVKNVTDHFLFGLLSSKSQQT